jgi:hypothetical protein
LARVCAKARQLVVRLARLGVPKYANYQGFTWVELFVGLGPSIKESGAAALKTPDPMASGGAVQMHIKSTAPVASSTVSGELVQALRADLMALADEIDRYRDIARLFTTADLGDLPIIVREYLADLPAAFDRLTQFVDGDLLEQLDPAGSD